MVVTAAIDDSLDRVFLGLVYLPSKYNRVHHRRNKLNRRQNTIPGCCESTSSACDDTRCDFNIGQFSGLPSVRVGHVPGLPNVRTIGDTVVRVLPVA